MSSKIICHCCGGAGIAISDKVLRNLEELGDGFADIKIKYIDTAPNNIEKIEHNPADVFIIKSKSNGGMKISGSGGDRRTNANDISLNMLDYANEQKLIKPVVGEYHLVVFSASGGSGSVIGPSLIKLLQEKNFPVVAVVIGDSTSGLNAKNTINTLATLNHVTTNMTKRALSVIYVNNHGNGTEIVKSKAASDKSIMNSIASLMLFLSGVNGDIDDQDMMNIIDQSRYTTYNIPAGLYGLSLFTGKLDLPANAIPTIGRSLAPLGVSPDIGLTLLHHKEGIVTEPNALGVYGDQFPIHCVTYANFFTVEQSQLKKIVDDYENILNSIVIADINGVGEVDENGMII